MLVRLWTHQYFPFITNIVESPNNGHIQGMAFVRGRYFRFSETYGKFIHSIQRGFSVIEGLSDFWSVRFERFYCIIKTPNCLGSYTFVFYDLFYQLIFFF